MRKKRIQKEIMMTKKAISTVSIFIISLILIIFSPAISLADANRIFKENNKAVVVVIAYDQKGKPISQGSGFIVREDGAIATNYHVISNARNIKVKTGDKVLEVEGLIHIDKENDLVILKAKGKNLSVIKIGDIAKTNIGDKVYVISSPQGLENTISDGILSGIREIDPKRKIFQITAPVSSGSSGGPVFNKNGEVIGITTFLIEEAQNLNFAMPVNLIKDKIAGKKTIAIKDAEIEDYKKTAEYWFYLGYYYGEAGLYDKAIEAYTRAIVLNPNDVNTYFNRGLAYAKGKRQYDRAIEDFNKAIAIDPNYADTYVNRGRAYAEKGQHERAIEDFNKAIAIDPNLAIAYNTRGNAYSSKGQHDKAIEDFDKAIAINPNFALAYRNRGLAYAGKKQYDRAIEDYNNAIELDLNDAIAYTTRGVAYTIKGNMGRAISDFQKACDLELELGCEALQKVLKSR